ncbi:MAG TPA: serine/threonine-protein kinase, partial [Candidatus Polarisedimenticolaceae bacterium]|nr:serine/threonine-protein kinase [Candidatus Polarisedimenticolaceae bacterium]
MSLETGGRLLHYRLVEKLGEGGMGVVWKALDTSLDRAVAIKVLPEGLSQDPERLARFEREAKTLAALNHPNIAAIHSVHHQDDRRFIVMEYVVGADLATRLARGPVPLDETVELMRQVAFALEAAHAGGVVHRDLKPANIVITPDGTAKVLDFGLAKAFYGDLGASAPGNPALSPTVTSAGTLPGVILGTAAYMSPEQARGRAVDRRADVWAFGCVLYEMLSGEVPFPGETVSDVLAGVLKAEPAWDGLPAATPSGVRRVIERCLRKDPRQRYHDVADLRLDLDERAGRSPHERGPSRAPASRARVAAGVAGCLALGLLAGWLLADRWPDRPVADRTTRSIVATDPAGRIDAVS